ncbi:MAG: Gfo/Idh/MocA family protein [Bryobacteraceae bacterium]
MANDSLLRPSRRAFVGTALASAASYSRILGANDRIRIGAIGTGNRCRYLLSLLNRIGTNEIVAVCDVYEPHRLKAKTKFAPSAFDCADHRELLDRKDIDAVVIGAPDHWHVPLTTAAVRAGKDVYCEKPVTHHIEEGEPLIRAVRESGRVVQTGTQQRSWAHYIQAAELVASGRLGQITFIRTYWYQNYLASLNDRPTIRTNLLDWKAFLGSAPYRPFDEDEYSNWRWYWDFGGGALTDLFVHWVDVAQWCMGENMASRATATGSREIFRRRQAPDTVSAALKYPTAMVDFECTLIGYLEGGGLMFRGTKAAMRLHRDGFRVFDELPHYSESYAMPAPTIEVKSPHDGTIDHIGNFLACVRSRSTPSAPVEVGVAAARAGHIANLAMRGSGVWNRETAIT